MDLTFKGTPGPWAQSHRETKGGMYSTEVYNEASLETIAVLSWYKKPKDENGSIGNYRAENAALIAAAPDLLKALVDILPHALIIINENHLHHKNAFAAIKKALSIKE